MFAGRANPEMEVTPTSKHRRRFQNLGRRSPGGEGGEMAGGDLHSRQFGRGEGRETLQNLLHRSGSSFKTVWEGGQPRGKHENRTRRKRGEKGAQDSPLEY